MGNEIRIRLRRYVEGALAANGDLEPVSDSDSLFVSGRMNSVDAVEAIVFLEENFSVDFEKIGFDQTYIDTVDAMMLLIPEILPSNLAGNSRSITQHFR